MKSKITILQGDTEQHFHTVPSEIGMITLPPERDAIFSHLARIHWSQFPEFISDVLQSVEKHTGIQITDGPGDETQDILSITPSGERHLSQCKHTADAKKHCVPDELDLLHAACHRKNCARGLLITNTDLTPQAKRYVTDDEYGRLATNQGTARVTVDYWNGLRIWERIAGNNAILNKWFSGMGQTHGLRRFWFYLVIHHMPAGKNHALKCADIAEALGVPSTHGVGPTHEFTLNAEATFSLDDWFARDLDMGVNYYAPSVEHFLVNIPLSAIKVSVAVAEKIGVFRPAQYRDAVVKHIGDRALETLCEGEW